MKGPPKIEIIRSMTKKVKAQPQEPFLIQTQWLFGMSVSWEVRQGLKEWESKMHIDKEVRALTICFNNLPLSIKFDLACKE